MCVYLYTYIYKSNLFAHVLQSKSHYLKETNLYSYWDQKKDPKPAKHIRKNNS